MKKISFILITVLCFTGQAFASDKYFYVGGAIGTTGFDGYKETYWIHEDSFINGQEFSGKGFVGYKFHKHLAIQTDAYYFGKPKDEDNPRDEYISYGFSGSVLGIIPLTDNIQFFTKIGFLYSRFEMKSNPGNIKLLDLDDPSNNEYTDDKWTVFNEDGFSVLVGGGLDIKITDKISFGVEVEWSPDVVDSDWWDSGEKLNFLNSNLGMEEDYKIGYDIDMDILFVSANVIYRF